MYDDPELLFHKIDLHSVMEHQRGLLREELQRTASNVVLNTPTPDLAETLASKYEIVLPELHREGAHVAQREADIDVSHRFDYGFYDDRRGPRTVTGTQIVLTIPFSGDKEMFFVRPSTYNLNPPRASVGKDSLTIRIQGTQLAQENVKSEIEQTISGIEQYLSWQRPTVDQFNASLRAVAETAIDERKKKLLRDQNLVAGLGFALAPRADAPRTYAAPQVRRKIEPKAVRPASTAPFKPEPVLDEKNYQAILGIIDNMTHVMERSPSAFQTLGEEDLRQHFLMQLNGQFEGQATGETFNFQGKTDILIRSEGRNIFIGECKFWKGEKAFFETVDQVLGYLSWRDTKAAILLFNRNKGFSEVVAKAETAMKGHPHVKRGPTKEGETRSRWVLGNPSDHNREIILTLMAFDVPTKSGA